MCDVPLLIEAQALEEQDVIAHIAIFGSPDPPMVSTDLYTILIPVIKEYQNLNIFYL